LIKNDEELKEFAKKNNIPINFDAQFSELLDRVAFELIEKIYEKINR